MAACKLNRARRNRATFWVVETTRNLIVDMSISMTGWSQGSLSACNVDKATFTKKNPIK